MFIPLIPLFFTLNNRNPLRYYGVTPKMNENDLPIPDMSVEMDSSESEIRAMVKTPNTGLLEKTQKKAMQWGTRGNTQIHPKGDKHCKCQKE